MLLNITARPTFMHKAINAMLASKDHLLIDPVTEEPWKFPVIPRSAFPESSDVSKVEQHKAHKDRFDIERKKLLDEAVSKSEKKQSGRCLCQRVK
jgi:hypothetical protein